MPVNDLNEYTLMMFVFSTLSLLAGWFIGNATARQDNEIVEVDSWDSHVQQALFVARRTRIEE